MPEEIGVTIAPDGGLACGRAPLIDAIAMFLAREHAEGMGRIRESIGREIDAAGPEAVAFLGRRLAGAGADWDYYPSDPLARRIHRALAPLVLPQLPQLTGAEHLQTVARAPVVIVANHLSYSDANVLDVLLQREGAASLADRLTVIAGPKVYSTLRRRFSSLCFGSIKVPQNSARSSEEAVMAPRDVARAAHRCLGIARERLRLGEAILVFPEGTRSRTSELQPFLPGVARYLDGAGTWVLPVGITGTESMFPVGADTLYPVPITVAIGQPATVGALHDAARGNRRLMMDAIGIAIASVLPEKYRGAYGGDTPDLEGARRVCRASFG
jgi:1-acyl-sn-glycerol-3-phosphate acyltransferase